MEALDHQLKVDVIDKATSFPMMVRHWGATLDGLIEEQFGDDPVNEVFEQFGKKPEESPIFTDPKYKPGIEMFMLLKRKIA